ncbi:MAG: hypothetical protein N2444_00175 [Methylocystis sp.]|nr:hypothetical protein [Methylocystis sp.]
MTTALALIGAVTVARWIVAAWKYFTGDRSGNSGRFGKHWSEE